MGLSSEELGRMTPRRFTNKLKGWRREKTEHANLLRICTYKIMQSSGNMRPSFNLKDVFPIGEIDFDRLTPEETEYIVEKWGRVLPGHRQISVKEFKKMAKEKIKKDPSILLNGR